mmetsp:Transcript_17014/g.29273  ORF Transcript_17014/g.29273 Transcript_17014/m.29273 type:complete len:82 (-) Transcript_17014:277-522(-)
MHDTSGELVLKNGGYCHLGTIDVPEGVKLTLHKMEGAWDERCAQRFDNHTITGLTLHHSTDHRFCAFIIDFADAFDAKCYD